MISYAWSGIVMEQAGTRILGLLCAGLAALAVVLGVGCWVLGLARLIERRPVKAKLCRKAACSGLR